MSRGHARLEPSVALPDGLRLFSVTSICQTRDLHPVGFEPMASQFVEANLYHLAELATTHRKAPCQRFSSTVATRQCITREGFTSVLCDRTIG